VTDRSPSARPGRREEDRPSRTRAPYRVSHALGRRSRWRMTLLSRVSAVQPRAYGRRSVGERPSGCSRDGMSGHPDLRHTSISVGTAVRVTPSG
jgi:hypothetical protein